MTEEILHYKTESKEGRLPVIEVFGPTIQGEGHMIGTRTAFIRFGGCDYRCKMCDSLHAVLPHAVKKNAHWLTIDDIIGTLDLLGGVKAFEWVTLSGGNPAIWDMMGLSQRLGIEGYRMCVETQGTIWRNWLNTVDFVTISPKAPGMGENFDPEVFQSFMSMLQEWQQSCIKIPIFDQNDIEFVVSVDSILNNMRYRGERFLSVGNPYPPVMKPDLTLDESPAGIQPNALRVALLDRYKSLLEDVLNDTRLRDWKFLPQLHVLVWANKAAV